MAVNHNIKYLKSLQAVREQSNKVFKQAQRGKLRHFAYDEGKVDAVVEYVYSLIDRDYGSIDKVPMHGRWRSYCIKTETGTRDLVSEHVARWREADISEWECARRIIDLFMVSVLVDAGAGSEWRFQDREFGESARTEGLGLAALRMFERGMFSSSPSNAFQVDAPALESFTDQALLDGFQVSEANPLLGCANRAQLLRNLGKALRAEPGFFGGICACNSHPARPGFMLDYLTGCAEAPRTVSVDDIWEVIVDGLAPVWPAGRTKLDGVPLGDVWQCDTLGIEPPVDESPGHPAGRRDSSGSIDGASVGKAAPSQPLILGTHSLVPFHKLSQWLTWSLLEVITRLGKFTVTGTDRLTGLPEYRNGGLFVDMGVLTLNASDRERAPAKNNVPQFDGSDPVIVEWRAMTVILLDLVASRVRLMSGLDDSQLPPMFLSRVLEGGTWKAGREIAASLRSDTKDPPINIISDGTLF
ncbi:hypothetical protein IW140_001567 [Coemansia sp. RSA 1813]|nr:hypothetical protein EV178_001672 [Coemansia sp. RSA 1646]KAJ1773406.1 hypothetical protein LPJ74_000659 [Coemansia sp. RSA 1843]KAJ2091341.1 hypothetical protein IW138_002040 [Coemansia sp. RSA 986]KAJ2216532.1 hypothetical protein EV179_001327 [Coemansia sp. RSA 487]KAJ2571387.1 hypothetical protein IW140_001567 [Coemansia sp. RSA 1813]